MRKKMKNKSYAVIGLGQFGMTVALTLAEANCDVLAIDDKDDNVQDIAGESFLCCQGRCA